MKVYSRHTFLRNPNIVVLGRICFMHILQRFVVLIDVLMGRRKQAQRRRRVLKNFDCDVEEFTHVLHK